MAHLQIQSASEQVAAHLKDEVERGALSETMPGEERLMRRLGVGAATVREALKLLENEGVLVGQGTGRRRKIVLPEDHAPPALRVAVLFYEKGDETDDLFIRFQNKLVAAGHTVVHAPKNLTDIGGNMRRLARMIKETEADAWVVIAGSEEVHRCFAQRQVPVFALYGSICKLGTKAGISPNQVPAIVTATRRLIALGHRRIVMLESRVTLSNPGADGLVFLDELAAHDIDGGQLQHAGMGGRIRRALPMPRIAVYPHPAHRDFPLQRGGILRHAPVPGPPGPAGAGGCLPDLLRCGPVFPPLPAVDLACPLERPAHGEPDRALGEQHQPREGRHPPDNDRRRVHRGRHGRRSAEVWKSGVRKSGVRSQESGVRSQESGVRSQESGVRSQESGVRSQESGVRSQEVGAD